ncbi:hypothetical protein A2U01_0070336 [Trifolium medium]|uniref:Uncharacterized protein n=1 Tax=Trifolium medium TaxID=97028 RepID=A0A392SJP4_9FABA|nr:hypothetical protein [Trifolium medium]
MCHVLSWSLSEQLATPGSAFQGHWRAWASIGDSLAHRERSSLSDQRKWPWPLPNQYNTINTP